MVVNAAATTLELSLFTSGFSGVSGAGTVSGPLIEGDMVERPALLF
jgi:hypothetical protein